MKPIYFSLAFAAFLFTGCSSKIDFDVPPPIPPVVVSDLLISEISTAINNDPAAGDTRPHYVELFNGTGATKNLADYAIGYQAVTNNTSLNPWNFGTDFFILTGNLRNDSCYVIASPTADRKVIIRDTSWGTTSTSNAQASNPLQLSGNSAIALLKKAAGGPYTFNGTQYAIIDVFGSPLVERVTAGGSSSSRNNTIWTIAGETSDTRNRTFLRKSSVLAPSTDWSATKGTTAENSQWTISGNRAWDYTNLRKKTP